MKLLLSWPFCCGKTTIIRKLETDFWIKKIIDDTTRPKRPWETDWFPYHFISRETFEANIQAWKYFEYIDFNGNYYWVPLVETQKENWALDLLSTTIPKYKGKIEGITSIYLTPPWEEELKRRALQRGDSLDTFQARMKLLGEEQPNTCDYIIEPLSLDEVYEKVKEILFSYQERKTAS